MHIREGSALTWDNLTAAPGVPPAVRAQYAVAQLAGDNQTFPAGY
jgi:hypothetical protein